MAAFLFMIVGEYLLAFGSIPYFPKQNLGVKRDDAQDNPSVTSWQRENLYISPL